MLTKMVKMVIEQLLLGKQQMLNQALKTKQKNTIISNYILIKLPESATSLTFRPSVFAINPITEKMTKPLIKQVASLNAAKISVSLE